MISNNEKSSRPLAVFGSFGFGNLGDELVPDCLAALLETLGHPAPLKALSRFDAEFPISGVQTLRDSREWFTTHQGANVFITGGGIIEPRPMSCLNRAFLMANGHKATKLRAFAISVEPGIRFGFRARQTLLKQLSQLGPVAVRDDLSARVLRKIAPNHPIKTVGDIGLWSQAGPVPEAIADIHSAPGIVVILQTTWPKEDVFPWLIPELITLARDHNLPITALPFSPFETADREIHQDLVKVLKQASPDIVVNAPADILSADQLTHSVAAAILENATLCISTRLHGCVTAFSQRTPFIALAYHPKLKGFAETVNWEDALLPSKPPALQSKGTYGYTFPDLNLQKNDLVYKAEQILKSSDFSAIDFYKQRQRTTLSKILE